MFSNIRYHSLSHGQTVFPSVKGVFEESNLRLLTDLSESHVQTATCDIYISPNYHVCTVGYPILCTCLI